MQGFPQYTAQPMPYGAPAQSYAAPLMQQQVQYSPQPPGSPPRKARVRWGRLVFMLLGLALLGFALSNMVGSTAPRNAGNQVVVDDDLREASAASARTIAPTRTTPTSNSATAAGGAAVTGPGAERSTRAARQQAAARRQRRARNARRARRAAALATAAGTATAAAARGGGANATATAGAEALPLTGLPVWVAALLGTLFLGAGMYVQLNAVRIGATAVLYRRGPLLRPVQCARTLRDCAPIVLEELSRTARHASPRAGSVLGLVGRALRAPARESDFVTSHRSRH